jgi:hypothetical protein
MKGFESGAFRRFGGGACFLFVLPAFFDRMEVVPKLQD